MPRNRSPPPWKTLALWNLTHGRQWLREMAHRQPPKRRLRARNRLRINQLGVGTSFCGLPPASWQRGTLWNCACVVAFHEEGNDGNRGSREWSSGEFHAVVHDALKTEQAIVCIGTRERLSETALKILSILEEAGTLESAAAQTGLALYRVRTGAREMSEAELIEQRGEVLATTEKGRALAAKSRAA